MYHQHSRPREGRTILWLAALVILCIGLGLACSRAGASTLQFTINSADFFDGQHFVGPYHSTVSGDNDDHSAAFAFPVTSFCIDFTSTVGFNEAFNIHAFNLATYTGPLKTEYWEAGYIALMIGNTTDTGVISVLQRAIWQITTPGSSDPYLHGQAVDAVVALAQEHYHDVNADTFTVWIKDGHGQNQLTINQVPEPATVFMIFFGFCLLALFHRIKCVSSPR